MLQVPLIAKAIIDIPVREIDKVFDYAIPEHLIEDVSVGSVVIVPFGQMKKIGFIVGLSNETEVDRILPIESLVNEQPVFDNKMVLLCEWISEYYLSTFAEALKLAIPPGFTSKIVNYIKAVNTVYENEKPSNLSLEISGQAIELLDLIYELGGKVTYKDIKTAWSGNNLSGLLKKLESEKLIERVYELERSKVKELKANYTILSDKIADDDMQEMLDSLKKAPKQRLLMEILYRKRAVRVTDLLSEAKAPHSSFKNLVSRGLIDVEERRVVRLPGEHFSQDDVDVELNDEQQFALSAIITSIEQNSADAYLLQGVTGSGKTEVYLRAIRHAIDLGKSAIVLVPEIVLTAQAVARFKARFGDEVAVLHSGLGAGERMDQWQGIREGRYKVVVGARSAIFAPVKNLGIIIVDEEHESSYKQGRNPRYNAREVAVMRAKLEGACVVLGSATPSLEVKRQSETGVLRPLHLRNRVQKRELPRMEIVDMRDEKHRNKTASNADTGNIDPQSNEDANNPDDSDVRKKTALGGLLKARIEETLQSG
ncbi:MAG: primosomal protein N', partial [Rubrobacteridae bacterium]|nr:primosomal protein N' [Rubrobacteridae bacterium]